MLLTLALASFTIPDSLLQGPIWTAAEPVQGSEFGACIAAVGDVDGDGYEDVVVGSPGFEDALVKVVGRIQWFRGTATGTSTSFAGTLDGTQEGSDFASVAAGVGDIDADGYPDVAVGARRLDAPAFNSGAVLVYRGSATGLAPTAAWVLTGDDIGDYLGNSITGAGDVDADGFADVIVGAPNALNSTHVPAGRVALHRGSSSGLLTTAAWTAFGSSYGEELGWCVAVGDVDGDGWADVCATSTNEFYGGIHTGAVRVFAGGSSGFGATHAWVAYPPPQLNAEFGAALAIAGDVNGDGRADLLVGSPNYKVLGNSVGRAALYLGAAAWPSTTPDWEHVSTVWGSEFGAAVAGIGDADGDGLDDWAIGSPHEGAGTIGTGRVEVWLGASGALPSEPLWSETGHAPNARFGEALFGGRDLDGDGDPELIVGAPGDAHYSGQPVPAGSVRTYGGGSACGPSVAAIESVVLGTPPNPPALLAGATHGPVIGRTWDPSIDHTSFAQLAVNDYLVVGAGAAGIPTPHGTLLVQLGAPYFLFQKAPGATFQIAVPDACAFVGVGLRAQAASLALTLQLELTNALDVVIGTY